MNLGYLWCAFIQTQYWCKSILFVMWRKCMKNVEIYVKPTEKQMQNTYTDKFTDFLSCFAFSHFHINLCGRKRDTFFSWFVNICSISSKQNKTNNNNKMFGSEIKTSKPHLNLGWNIFTRDIWFGTDVQTWQIKLNEAKITKSGEEGGDLWCRYWFHSFSFIRLDLLHSR